MTPATKAALFMYLEVPSAFAVQVFFFNQAPTTNILLGASCITFAALCRLAYEMWSAAGQAPNEMLMSPLGSPLMSPKLTFNPSPFGTPVSPVLTAVEPPDLVGFSPISSRTISPFDLPLSADPKMIKESI